MERHAVTGGRDDRQSAAPTLRIAWAWAVVLLVALAGPAGAAGQTGPEPSRTPPPPEEAGDPLGRDTPRGTIAGFNLAVHREDFQSAARFLQLSAGGRRDTERLARDLADLIDRYYIQPLAALSDDPQGTATDGLALDRERVILTMAGKPVDLELVRVKDREAGLVWLVSAQTLARVPALRRSAGVTWLEGLMPAALVDARLFGLSIAQWVAWAATLLVPAAALWLLSAIVIASARAVSGPKRRALIDTWYGGLRWPVILVVTLAVHVAAVPLLGFSLAFRFGYSRLELAVVVLAVAWFLWRLMALSFTHARIMALRRGQASVRSLLLLAERVSKTIVALAAVFALLTIAGVDTTTALAGVGIGGVAIALGAQRSVENLLGGVFLLTDRALAVGDTCSIADRLGVVEDITMRSVRLRTLEQTLLSVPAGVLAQSSVENFATRDKILVLSTLRLRYDTTAAQLRQVLGRIRGLLEERPEIEKETARIRLVDFGVYAIELELFAYLLTPDFSKFLALREELLLQVAAIVESSGSGFARPEIDYGISAAEATSARFGGPNRGTANRSV
ncbi:MAG TPA: mechanosensitive ion channel [Vicinamibacterales bacterium]|nr:mechanosensitive ion channel [Acidobacteriota bacterium]HOC18400.1 mechanosensitive ion channel [Vicinamibacterales bacterium]